MLMLDKMEIPLQRFRICNGSQSLENMYGNAITKI